MDEFRGAIVIYVFGIRSLFAGVETMCFFISFSIRQFFSRDGFSGGLFSLGF
jgi:hypothetical protein